MSEEQLMNYTPSQQRELVSRVASATNKRIKNLTSKGMLPAPLIRIQESGGKISVRGKTGDTLINEFNRAKQFMKSKISSVSGYKKEVKKIEADIKAMDLEGSISRIAIEKGMDKSTLVSNAFSIYDVLSQTNAKLVSNKDRYKIAGHIADLIYYGATNDEVIMNTIYWLEQEYNKVRKSYDETVEGNILGNRLENDTPKRYRRKRR